METKMIPSPPMGCYDTVWADAYISAVPRLAWRPADAPVWRTIRNEGLDEETGAMSRADWEVADMRITESEAMQLRLLADEALEGFNLFDIRLKEAFGGTVVDLIDYDAGTVRLVRPRKG